MVSRVNVAVFGMQPRAWHMPTLLQVRKQLAALGVGQEAATRVLAVMACGSLEELQQALGPSEAVDELQMLFQLAEGYGYGAWLEYDASVVRGLAYYTGARPFLGQHAQTTVTR